MILELFEIQRCRLLESVAGELSSREFDKDGRRQRAFKIQTQSVLKFDRAWRVIGARTPPTSVLAVSQANARCTPQEGLHAPRCFPAKPQYPQPGVLFRGSLRDY